MDSPVFALTLAAAVGVAVALLALYAARPVCAAFDGDCAGCAATPGCAPDPDTQRCQPTLAPGDPSVACGPAPAAGASETGAPAPTPAPSSPPPAVGVTTAGAPVGTPLRLRTAAGRYLCVTANAPALRDTATDEEATLRLEAGGALVHVHTGLRLHSAAAGDGLAVLTAGDAARERAGETWRPADDRSWQADAVAVTLLLVAPASTRVLIAPTDPGATAPRLAPAPADPPPSGAEDVFYWEAV